ncbi:MAG TPA: ASCH domain-containing protein [Candidatus Absconditabacterales bacterium]|nr:ASCH domain-containing protein [Candidatus Absconditabacterales bacterium]HMT26840.1 ASCH domain-containing protein [Candidatus Absconditabacterales bacterium]
MTELFIKMPYLLEIKSGKKTVEARANYSNLRKIQEGQEVVFVSGSLRVNVIVERISLYKSVDEMLENEEIDTLIPGANFEEALTIYNSIYPPDKVKKNNGMRVFSIKLM